MDAREQGGDQIKSCKIDPVSKTRPKGPADKRGPGVGEKRKRSAGEDDNPARCDRKNKIWEEAFKVGPKGSYSVHENNGILYIIQYKYEGCDKEFKLLPPAVARTVPLRRRRAGGGRGGGRDEL